MSNYLARKYPGVGANLPIIELGELPTPVSSRLLLLDSGRFNIAIKHDDLTGTRYGGNKVRKLEYLLRRALDRGAKRVATFGSVGSNHALATALYARVVGLECTCFLMHQSLRPGLGNVLRFHQQHGTEVVRYGGDRARRVASLRRHLHGRSAWVIPLGGSSWLGSLGFVNAGLEMAEQVRTGDIPHPSAVYVALGTMGTAAGLALGLALGGLDTRVQAIRVTDEKYANKIALDRLIKKTAALMRAYDPQVPADLAARTNIVCRNEFFGDGYGISNASTEAAIQTADQQLDLSLESTYSGKAMAALLHDVNAGCDMPVLFWNTYNSRPLEIDNTVAPDFSVMPREFERYFDW